MYYSFKYTYLVKIFNHTIELSQGNLKNQGRMGTGNPKNALSVNYDIVWGVSFNQTGYIFLQENLENKDSMCAFDVW